MYNLVKIVEDTITTDWQPILLEDTEALEEIGAKLDQEEIQFYPPPELIFNAFSFFNILDLKVCIIGMDPYHGPGQAMGLSFSVFEDQKVPPSLRNIFKEISSDLEIDTSGRNGDLTCWVLQGVLLLNAALTVRHKKAGSHSKFWKKYTDALIRKICENTQGTIFILWGNLAKKKAAIIEENENNSHHIISGVHPSPLSASRGFFGCKHFSKCNNILIEQGREPIDW